MSAQLGDVMKVKALFAFLMCIPLFYSQANAEVSALPDPDPPQGVEPLMEEVEQPIKRRRAGPKRDKSQLFKRDKKATMLGLIDIVNVRDLLKYRDNYYDSRQVMLNGVFTRSLAPTEFEFQDATGVISVFYTKDIELINYSMETEAVVTIYGEVDITAYPRTINMIDIKLN